MIVKDLVDFVLVYRRGKAFKEWSFEEIVLAIRDAAEDKSIAWCVDNCGQINGIVLARIDHNNREIYVTNLLTKPETKGIIPALLQKAEELYPLYRISGRRRERIKNFNPPLLKKFSERL